ncbi:Hypothetical predicted protein [Cloeon dipterum]|uniref:Uncharacterized protein n=1 Tax=Cloeon dipterum TaxID=197152 RepID=A0A8S1CYX6_9INSE|nr:Hypothetical predicted protein [Cloeon dipterum]
MNLPTNSLSANNERKAGRRRRKAHSALQTALFTLLRRFREPNSFSLGANGVQVNDSAAHRIRNECPRCIGTHIAKRRERVHQPRERKRATTCSFRKQKQGGNYPGGSLAEKRMEIRTHAAAEGSQSRVAARCAVVWGINLKT